MSNAIFHNKWHGFNHYTIPLVGYPDSATDPIASLEYPFRGIFYNTIVGNYGLTLIGVTLRDPGSGFTFVPSVSFRAFRPEDVIIPPVFKVDINRSTNTLSSIEILKGGQFLSLGVLIFTPVSGDILRIPAETTTNIIAISPISNSFDWGFYSSLTKNNSADWGKYSIVRDKTQLLSSFWDLGFLGYTALRSASGRYDSVLTQSVTLSPETRYDGSGGTGWHIALSSVTHKTNIPYQIDTRQKVAVPVRLFEDKINKTLTWDLSAQTVYFTITGTDSLTARDIINPKRGGKYTMWITVDRCPPENSNIIFDNQNYNISVKTLTDTFVTNNNILALTASHITRLDFVYDGSKMLGKATRYRIFAPTQDDLYFQGTGIRFEDPDSRANKSPVFLNPDTGKLFGVLSNPLIENTYTLTPEEDNIIALNGLIGGGIIIENFSNEYTETSSFYIPGSGINMRFLNSDNQYFSFNLTNAEWPSKTLLNTYRSLTGSFDRVEGVLSGGNFALSAFASNLFASPDESLVTDNIILSAFPTSAYGGPYELRSSNLRSVRTCTSAFTVNIFSGKDRDISNLFIDDVSTGLIPLVVSGMRQPYTFNNERAATITFERIQSDISIDVVYAPQVPLLIPNLVLWFNSMDSFMLFPTTTNLLTTWNNNTRYFNLPTPGENSTFIGFGGSTNSSSNDESRILSFTFTSSRNTVELKDFKDNSSFIGDASWFNNGIRLTSNNTNRSGTAFYNIPVFIKDTSNNLIDWSVTLSFTLTSNGSSRGDGITFILQSNRNNFNNITSQGMGYRGIPNSIGIGFDTFQNTGFVTDQNNNHVELNVNGDIQNSLIFNNIIPQLRGGIVYSWIDYEAENNFIKIYISATGVKPQTPSITQSLDIFEYLKYENNPDSIFKLAQQNTVIAPLLSTNKALRYIDFTNNKSLSSNYPITPLSSNKSAFFNSFSTFTVFRTTSTFPTSAILWWVGDFNQIRRDDRFQTRGYGLVLSGRQLFTISNFRESYTNLDDLRSDVTYLSANTLYIVGTRYNSNFPTSQQVYVNGRPTIYQRSLRSNTATTPASSQYLTFGKNPNENTGFSNVLIYDFYLYDNDLPLSEIIRMNRFLTEKFQGYVPV